MATTNWPSYKLENLFSDHRLLRVIIAISRATGKICFLPQHTPSYKRFTPDEASFSYLLSKASQGSTFKKEPWGQLASEFSDLVVSKNISVSTCL